MVDYRLNAYRSGNVVVVLESCDAYFERSENIMTRLFLRATRCVCER